MNEAMVGSKYWIDEAPPSLWSVLCRFTHWLLSGRYLANYDSADKVRHPRHSIVRLPGLPQHYSGSSKHSEHLIPLALVWPVMARLTLFCRQRQVCSALAPRVTKTLSKRVANHRAKRAYRRGEGPLSQRWHCLPAQLALNQFPN